MSRSLLAAVFLTLLLSQALFSQQQKTRAQKVREDQQKVTSAGFWVYNDLPKAFEKAKESGKPILVVLRCIPCEECVKLDDDLVDTDPVLQPLLQKFVCVRVVSTNGLDLSLFQYDTDQSFAVFMLNADRTVYGRFGTRSHRSEWVADVSLKGLAEALQGALELHADYPANKTSLEAKSGPKPLFESPEKFPSLTDKYTSSLNYAGDVVKSCIHCHQIGDAVRDYYRDRSEAIPEEILSPYPHPKSLGMILDPSKRGTLKEVVPDSIAASAGLKAADRIQTLQGQPVLSTADVQWVLHNIPASGGKLNAKVKRDDKQIDIGIQLPNGWRRLDDISWRVTSWGLRRMGTGGLLLQALSAEERAEAGLTSSGMALKAVHVGQYDAHAAAKKAGFLKNDILVSFDGRTDLMTDSDVLRYAVTVRKPGETVPVEIIRDGERKRFIIPMQK